MRLRGMIRLSPAASKASRRFSHALNNNLLIQKNGTCMQLPLEDIKVLDLSHALAGPFCSTMLADYGAQVIKIEPPGLGDIARAWGTPLPGGETDYFVSLHRNKKGMAVSYTHLRAHETR